MSDGSHTYQWDAEGKLVSVNNGSTESYTYNALGQQVRFVAPNWYTWDHLFGPDGTFLAAWSGGTSWWPSGVFHLGDRQFAQNLDQTYFVHANGLGSTSLTTNAAGQGNDENLYYPWGQAWVGGISEWRYSGFDVGRDSATGFYPTPNRQYNPLPGRWMSPDPHNAGADPRDPQTWNLYAYVRNNPTTNTDPTGLCTVDNEAHNWLWCAAHALGFTTTLEERRDWLSQNIAVSQGGRAISSYWATASAAEVNDEYNRAMAYEAMNTTLTAFSPIMWAGAQDLVSGGQTANIAGGMLGVNGPQFTSKTVWTEGDARIDVENPAPGQRPGQIHYQDSTGKYIYDVQSGRFQGLSQTKNEDLLSRPEVQQAIQKGLKYLGM